MMKFILFLHILGACVWVGGHIYLLVRLMPKFIKNNDVAGFLAFEKSYEPLGMAALLVQVITGLYMVHAYIPNVAMLWDGRAGILGHLVGAKILWLILTICTALSARFGVIHQLTQNTYTHRTLKIMGVHVFLIVLWSLLFVLTGVAFR